MHSFKYAFVGLVALGMSSASAIAQTNPWHPDQTTVPVTVTVNEMVELFTGTAPVALAINDAGENQGSVNAVSRNVTHLSNVAIDVFAEIDDDIPVSTQFHILINPNSSWSALGSAGAAKVISWRRDAPGTSYTGATGGAPNQVSSGGVGSANKVLAFSAAASASMVNVPIQYFADARNEIPQALGATDFNVVWTIAPTPTP